MSVHIERDEKNAIYDASFVIGWPPLWRAYLRSIDLNASVSVEFKWSPVHFLIILNLKQAA
jgi:hypothetical protein